ncbi:cobyrinate a,c-diamide synthase [Vreelandella sp. TE19]
MGAAVCPAVLIAAPASSQGKTTLTAALARQLVNQGKVVRVFKTGPDYLDPQILAQAARRPAEQLDLWMMGETECRQRLYDAAVEADLILIEGVMGLFDGEPSSADLAALFDIPLAVVMDVKGMAQTAGALMAGLASARDDIRFAGLIANHCNSQRHRELIEHSLSPATPLLAAIPRDSTLQLPVRHLGLVQPDENRSDMEQRLEAGARAIAESGLAQALLAQPPVAFSAPIHAGTEPPVVLAGRTIGIARDAAFSFIYPANLEALTRMGASLRFFSPLEDTRLPECNALWLPGGYPELHSQRLADNISLKAELKRFFEQDRPILAECGGMLYCMQTLAGLGQSSQPMLGLLSGHGIMRDRGGCQGMQTAVLPEGEIRGHAHHRSRVEGAPMPVAAAQRQRHPALGEPIYRERGLTATYLHLYFPNNPAAIARLLGGAE